LDLQRQFLGLNLHRGGVEASGLQRHSSFAWIVGERDDGAAETVRSVRIGRQC
jgi:hypothetical protein